VSIGSRVAVVALAGAVLAAIGGCGELKQIGAGAHNGPPRTFTITGHVTTVIIDGGSSSITVTGSDRGTILVSQQASYSKTAPATSRRVADGTLTLSYSCGGQLVCSVQYDVQVPRGVAVRASSRTGSITLTSLTGDVTAQTDAGLITTNDLSSATVALKSNAGGIIAAFSAVPGSLSAATNIGSISITVPTTVSYQIHTHTYLGSSTVRVTKNPASRHVITASSDLGSISISPA
jgi:DUF4097 and DUF4098 domain-containing protein YvlB